MKKQSSKPARRKTRGVVLGTLAAGVALTSAFAVTGVTPSSALNVVLAPERTAELSPAKISEPAPAKTSEPAPAKASAPARPAQTPAPAVSKEAAVAENVTGATGDQPAVKPPTVKPPKVSGGVGVAPPKPKGNDAELGRTPQKKNKLVKLTDKVQLLEGMTVGISNLAAVPGIADEPGEVAGDAVKVSVTLTNTGTTPADTSSVVVDLEAGPNSTPGLTLRGDGSSTFPASIEPGASATADYVFVVDSAQRSRVSVSVNYSVTAPIAVFEGTAPPAKGKK